MAEKKVAAKKPAAKKPAAKVEVKKVLTKGEEWTKKNADKIKAARDKNAASIAAYDAGYKAGLVAGKKQALQK
jgi:hypothetical protein